MKKKIIIILSVIICLSSALSSCSFISEPDKSDPSASNTERPTDDGNSKIKELEAQIISLLQSQQLSESERKNEIAALKAEIELLKSKNKETQSNNANTETASPTETEPEEKDFTYTLNGYKATITSTSVTNETLIIPSVIDGHPVGAIGQEILPNNNKIKRIIISSGIETIDWFAFENCTSLLSITIPSSVTSIGYGAFNGAPKSFTIECTKDSFTEKYAQSYGIKYNSN